MFLLRISNKLNTGPQARITSLPTVNPWAPEIGRRWARRGNITVVSHEGRLDQQCSFGHTRQAFYTTPWKRCCPHGCFLQFRVFLFSTIDFKRQANVMKRNTTKRDPSVGVVLLELLPWKFIAHGGNHLGPRPFQSRRIEAMGKRFEQGIQGLELSLKHLPLVRLVGYIYIYIYIYIYVQSLTHTQ